MPSTLIVNADDFGSSSGTTDAIIEGHRGGIITSASMVVTTPSFSDAAEAAKKNPTLGVGLHFTLTAGRPAASHEQVNRLIDEKGFLSGSFSGFLFRPADSELLAQIKTELDAQLQRLKNAGLKPDHINSERHVHLIPGIFGVVARAAQENGIPFIRLVRDAGWRYLTPAHVGHYAVSAGPLKSWLLNHLSARCRRSLPAGVKATDFYATLLYTGRMDLVFDRLLAAPPEGVTEIAVHPGYVRGGDCGTGSSSLEAYLNSPDREMELKACLKKTDLKNGARFTRFADIRS